VKVDLKVVLLEQKTPSPKKGDNSTIKIWWLMVLAVDIDFYVHIYIYISIDILF